MRGNSYKKNKKEPQIKIGSKKENILYSEKNIDPKLNFLNKQLSQEEYSLNMRKKYQKEEFSSLSKNFQDNYMGPPNLAHQRIDFDNVAGKIGQERREIDINKYQKQPSFAKDQVYNTYINNDKEKNNKKYYHNIINNTIFGFCDPTMKYPKTSYQSNYQGNEINEQLKYLSQRQYEDYLKFRKEQIEIMNKGNLGKNLRELPPRKKRMEMGNEDIQNIKEMKDMREKKYKEDAENLMKEQRLLDQNQFKTLNPSGYIPTPEEYELYLQQQKMNALNSLNNNNSKDNNIDERIRKNNMNNYLPPQEISNEDYYNYLQQKERGDNMNELSSQYNNKPQFSQPHEKYGNEIPKTYEDYNLLIEKDKNRSEDLIINKDKYMGDMNTGEEIYRQNMIDKKEELYNNEERIKEIERKEAEEEYLKNVKKYEDIIQDNPEQKFKLPPPPFGRNNMPSLNKMSMESQLQGASTGFINKNNIISENPYSINNYSLGESTLSQNPILHPVNSYQFDYSRLYNPLINK
jgi:hypothetical protein